VAETAEHRLAPPDARLSQRIDGAGACFDRQVRCCGQRRSTDLGCEVVHRTAGLGQQPHRAPDECVALPRLRRALLKAGRHLAILDRRVREVLLVDAT